MLKAEITREGIKITSPIEPEKSITMTAHGAFLDDAGGSGGLPMTQHELMRLLDIWAKHTTAHLPLLMGLTR